MSARHTGQTPAGRPGILFEWLAAGLRKWFNHSVFLFEWKTSA
jgi:hypothetical protein